MGLTLLTGGARSGKSVLAVRIAEAHDGPVTFIATAEPRDDEMAARIAQHRKTRPADWDTVEEPVDLAGAIVGAPRPGVRDRRLPDALGRQPARTRRRIAKTWKRARRKRARRRPAGGAPVLVVTNEVGSGIVPMHPETRSYRDLMGTVNAIFARDAEHVLLVVAGRALALSPVEEVIPDVFGR